MSPRGDLGDAVADCCRPGGHQGMRRGCGRLQLAVNFLRRGCDGGFLGVLVWRRGGDGTLGRIRQAKVEGWHQAAEGCSGLRWDAAGCGGRAQQAVLGMISPLAVGSGAAFLQKWQRARTGLAAAGCGGGFSGLDAMMGYVAGLCARNWRDSAGYDGMLCAAEVC
jgi:hypothetical protein